MQYMATRDDGGDLHKKPPSKPLEFFFKVTCACRNHPRYRHTLCLTSLPFFVAAWRLIHGGIFFAGACTAALGSTSVLYHATHAPGVRAADVLVLWLTGAVGAVEALAGIWAYGANVGLVIGLLGVLFLGVIFAAPYFSTNGTIRLQWHMAVHLIAAFSLLCLAAGFPHPASENDMRAIEARQWDAWCGAIGGAAALVLGTTAVHSAQSSAGPCTPCQSDSVAGRGRGG